MVILLFITLQKSGQSLTRKELVRACLRGSGLLSFISSLVIDSVKVSANYIYHSPSPLNTYAQCVYYIHM